MNRIMMAVAAGAVAGALLTIWLGAGFNPAPGGEAKGLLVTDETPAKPLYWVAPMDPSYRRNKPGKSPMGMDLKPVYAESSEDADQSNGSVRISPDVVNNLGVRTAQVQRQTLYAEVNTVGYIKYDENQLVHIHPRVEGWVEKLYVKAEGDPVALGQPLYDIYSPALVNAQEELVAALGRNNQRLIKAAKARLEALQLPGAAIEALVETKEVQTSTTFYAPQSGVIDNLNIREGFFVKPGTMIMSIGGLSEVWVEAEVLERQASLVEEGAAVIMRLDYLPGKVWKGKVDYIYPTLDEKTRTLALRLRFDNPDNELRPNMYAQVTIVSSSDETLLVPREAVIRSGTSNRVVLALGKGRFRSIEITMGRSNEQFIEVLKGISAGDRVVTSAQFLLDSESSKTADFNRLHHDSSGGGK